MLRTEEPGGPQSVGLQSRTRRKQLSMHFRLMGMEGTWKNAWNLDCVIIHNVLELISEILYKMPGEENRVTHEWKTWRFDFYFHYAYCMCHLFLTFTFWIINVFTWLQTSKVWLNIEWKPFISLATVIHQILFLKATSINENLVCFHIINMFIYKYILIYSKIIYRYI